MSEVANVSLDSCRVLISEDPFPVDRAELPWNDRGLWPCHWITPAQGVDTPFVAAFRLHFPVAEKETVRIHVTADERYELYLDGELVGRGSERGDANHWYFETYDLTLAAGEHTLVARVWALGDKSAIAQHSAAPGFLLCPQSAASQATIGTGKAPWAAKLLAGYEFISPLTAWGTGHNLHLSGSTETATWRFGGGDGWEPCVTGLAGMAPGVNDRDPQHILRPATLPPMLEARWTKARVRHVSTPPSGPTSRLPILAEEDRTDLHDAWQSLIDGTSALTIAAGTRRRAILDMGDYLCAYPRAVLNGGTGATFRIHWQESLYEGPAGGEKGNRDEIEGKYFRTIWHEEDGVGDRFTSGGQFGQRFEPLWWQAGRYVEIYVETQDEPLSIERLEFFETHYPYDFESTFAASDHRFSEVEPIMRRALEMCSHETYMDCPFYEQLQYAGDTRLQVLATYTLTSDDRLPRKALAMFNASRELSGLTQSRYPNRIRQIIPPFSLWWVCMVHDYARYRGDLDFVRGLMPGVRAVLDAYRTELNAQGLLGPVDGWNFIDWVPTWKGGMAKDASGGVSGILNLHLILTLRKAAQLESILGETELAQRNQKLAEALAGPVHRAFWSAERGLYANDLGHTEFSEHAQALALLTGVVPASERSRLTKGLLEEDLDRTTIYFRHYLFEAFNAIGRTDLILERMSDWFEHPARGLKTTIEHPEPTRSDCHAWGAHPLFHYFASFLGIRPVGPGFSKVDIEPQLGGLEWAVGTMPTPLGPVSVDASIDRVVATIPDGMQGVLTFRGQRIRLQPGENRIEVVTPPSPPPTPQSAAKPPADDLPRWMGRRRRPEPDPEDA